MIVEDVVYIQVERITQTGTFRKTHLQVIAEDYIRIRAGCNRDLGCVTEPVGTPAAIVGSQAVHETLISIFGNQG